MKSIISLAVLALVATDASAHMLVKKSAHAADYVDEQGEEISTSLAVQLKDKHACDYVDDSGEEISTSLAVQLNSDVHMKDEDDTGAPDTVAATRQQMAELQATMDAKVAVADKHRAQQKADFTIHEEGDSSGQLSGLMKAHASLAAFKPVPKTEKI